MSLPSPGKWIGSLLWSLLDQGLFALSNFVLNVLLARWLGESDYGAFSIAFSIFLFLGAVYSALMVEPMLVFGPGRYEGAFPHYLRMLGRVHWRTAALATALLGLVCAVFYYGSPVFPPLLALALLSGVIFQQWLLRRACYVRMEPREAALGGLLYFAVMLGGIFGLREAGKLGAVQGILLMALASLAASLWILFRLRSREKDNGGGPDRATLIRDHWNYGRWAVATNALSWFPSNIYLLILPVWHGEEASGALRASFNLALPVLLIATSAGTMLLPVFVKARKARNFSRMLGGILLLLAVPSVLYTGLIAMLGKPLFLTLYDGAYTEQAHLAWLVVLVVVPGSLAVVLGAALRAMEASSRVFTAYVGASLACLLAGLPLTALYGVAGAAAGMILASLTTAGIMAIQLRRLLRSPVSAAPEAPAVSRT